MFNEPRKPETCRQHKSLAFGYWLDRVYTTEYIFFPYNIYWKCIFSMQIHSQPRLVCITCKITCVLVFLYFSLYRYYLNVKQDHWTQVETCLGHNKSNCTCNVSRFKTHGCTHLSLFVQYFCIVLYFFSDYFLCVQILAVIIIIDISCEVCF